MPWAERLPILGNMIGLLTLIFTIIIERAVRAGGAFYKSEKKVSEILVRL